MKNRFSAICLVLMLAMVAFFAVACTDVGSKIVKYSDRAQHRVERLSDEQVLDEDDANRLLPLISDVRTGGEAYTAIEQELKATSDEQKKLPLRERLRVAGQLVLERLQRLNDEGVLHIKNERTRLRVQQGLAFAEILTDLVS